MQTDIYDPPDKREPVLNVPAIVVAMLGLMVMIHIARLYALSYRSGVEFIFYFAFIPARFSNQALGIFADWSSWWTPLSYSFLHGDWTHIIVNSVWMLAFGSVVARRFGLISFLIFCAIGSIAGALAHFAANPGSQIPMIGASAIVSACMGASVRFAFPINGRFGKMAHLFPAQSLLTSMRNPQAMAFVGVWFVINLLFGLGGEMVAGEGQSIAWQAHLGGFVVGFLGFGLFDR